MGKFVSRSEVAPYIDIFEKAIKKIRQDCKAEGITFTHRLVGSAKRNLIVRHFNKGFDCDYQIIIQKNKKSKTEKELKRVFIRLFDKYIPNEFDYCEDSTSAITIIKKDGNHSRRIMSYDIVLLQERNGLQIIRRQGDNYEWNSLPKLKNYSKDIREIKGKEMWEDLRERYYKKKINAMENPSQSKKAFQLFHEAVMETLRNN